ncbi:uncharacterized protein LOC144569564 [Carex rostrata]
MLLGFISLLLTVSQGSITNICVPKMVSSSMLPCKKETLTNSSNEAGNKTCAKEGEVPLLSLEALHQLHIFIFVLAVVHVVFCATTMVLGGAKEIALCPKMAVYWTNTALCFKKSLLISQAKWCRPPASYSESGTVGGRGCALEEASGLERSDGPVHSRSWSRTKLLERKRVKFQILLLVVLNISLRRNLIITRWPTGFLLA